MSRLSLRQLSWAIFVVWAVVGAWQWSGRAGARPTAINAARPREPMRPPATAPPLEPLAADIDGGPVAHHLTYDDLAQLAPIMIQHQGDTLFRFMFTRLDGAATRSIGDAKPASLSRLSGPESQSCSSCHSQLTTVDGLLLHVPGGAGDTVTNTFNQAGVTNDLTQVNHRNTRAVYGSGLKQQIAEEMTAELSTQAEAASTRARATGSPITVDLYAKGVNFGRLTATPDQKLDTSALVGVDPDLVIKPFSAKGTGRTLREFTEDAAMRHMGLPSAASPQASGALTPADITALVIWQANRPAPRQVEPLDAARAESARLGQSVFYTVGCANCHIPVLPLSDTQLKISTPESTRVLSVDLTALGLKASSDGPLPVPLFSDLKRHDLGPDLAEPLAQAGVPGEQFITAPLWGVASTGPWLHDGRATTLTDAILWHSGEAASARSAFMALPRAEQRALTEFLRTLVIEPYPTDLPHP